MIGLLKLINFSLIQVKESLANKKCTISMDYYEFIKRQHNLLAKTLNRLRSRSESEIQNHIHLDNNN